MRFSHAVCSVAEPEPGKKKGKKGKKLTKKQRIRKRRKEMAKQIDEEMEKQRLEAFKGKGAYVRSTRKCTDCLPCCVMIAYWVGMLILAQYAFENGNLNDLILPKDKEGHTCGTDNARTEGPDLRNTSRLYFPNPADEKMSICVPYCPGSFPGKCLGNNSRDYYAEVYNAAVKATRETVKQGISDASKWVNNNKYAQQAAGGLGINTSNANSSLQNTVISTKKPGLKKDQSVLKEIMLSVCNSKMPGLSRMHCSPDSRVNRVPEHASS